MTKVTVNVNTIELQRKLDEIDTSELSTIDLEKLIKESMEVKLFEDPFEERYWTSINEEDGFTDQRSSIWKGDKELTYEEVILLLRRQQYRILRLQSKDYPQKVQKTLQEAYNQNKKHGDYMSSGVCIMLENIAEELGVEIK